MPSCRQYASWLVAGLVLGCGGGSSGPGPTPSIVIKTAGDAQIGVAGTALATPLEVTVKDAGGNPVAGVNVAFAVASGGGSVAPTSASTGADGKATTVRTLGPGAGPQTATATVTGIAPATFSSVATINGAVTIAVSGSAARIDTVKGTVVPDLVVLVKDPNGLAVPGIIVTWTVSGGGHLSQLTDTTDANGQSSVTWTFDSIADTQTARAAVAGLVGSPVAFTGTAVPGNAVSLSLVAGDKQAGPVSSALSPHQVVVRDAYGNGEGGLAVVWTAGSGVTLSGPQSTTNSQGIASITVTLGPSPGVFTDTATFSGASGSPVVFTDTAVAVEQIQVGNNFFSPVTDTIPAGTFLKFHWSPGGVLHSVVWLTGSTPLPDNSGAAQTSGDFIVRVAKTGSYTYECGVHGAAMPGAIVAQ